MIVIYVSLNKRNIKLKLRFLEETDGPEMACGGRPRGKRVSRPAELIAVTHNMSVQGS